MSTTGTAYIKDGRFFIVGVSRSRLGTVPYAVSVAVQDQTEPDGPVNVAGDMSDGLLDAMKRARREVKKELTRSRLKLAAETLVLRSRSGDQNAMAMIGAIRNSARKGVKRARLTFRILREYIKTNPAGKSDFGKESKPREPLQVLLNRAADTFEESIAIVSSSHESSDPYCAAIMVANRGPVAARLSQVTKMIPNGSAASFTNGYKRSATRDLSDIQTKDSQAFQIGYIMGLALRLEMARKGKCNALCPMAAWELGQGK